jgi:phospholipid transport system substrate-binding protein
MRHALFFVLVCFLLRPIESALAKTATDQVRHTTDRIIAILNDPALSGDSHRQQRQKLIRQELEERFDWNVITRSVLGRHWTKMNAQQQKEFTQVFQTFLERVYLDRIEPYYAQLDQITYRGEKIIDKKYASVQAVITTTQKIDHPVEYRLHQTTPGAWQVYDVIVEGVSLVRNYRTQFDEVISRSGYQGLIGDLKRRTETNKLDA